MKEGFNPRVEFDQELAEKYFQAREIFDKWIEPYSPNNSNYRYDLPENYLKIGDEDYDKFMCRRSVFDGIRIHAFNFSNLIKDFNENDKELIEKINASVTGLFLLGNNIRNKRKSTSEEDVKMTEDEMLVLKNYVNDIISSCKTILENNKGIVALRSVPKTG